MAYNLDFSSDFASVDAGFRFDVQDFGLLQFKDRFLLSFNCFYFGKNLTLTDLDISRFSSLFVLCNSCVLPNDIESI